MENKFKKILLENEEIIKIYKPVKKKFFTKVFFLFLFLLLFTSPFITFFFIANNILNQNNFKFLFFIPVGIFVLIDLSLVIGLCLSYRNLAFALTNKRIIIRKGAFGVNYFDLKLESITSTNVVVSPIDKLFKNTGSIFFHSSANPTVKKNNYVFNDILNPYDEYKFISNYIVENKKQLTGFDSFMTR